jgi:hypothetical protein
VTDVVFHGVCVRVRHTRELQARQHPQPDPDLGNVLMASQLTSQPLTLVT